MQHLRMAAPNDIPAILEIYRPYILETTYTFEKTPPTLGEFTLRFEKITASFPWLVWEDEDGIAGYAYASSFHERAAFQWSADLSIYLSSKKAGNGIGKKLYLALMELLEQMGYYTVYGEVTGENLGSIAFHQALGFIQEGCFFKTGNKFGRWCDLITLSKPLRKYEENPQPIKTIGQLDSQKIQEILKKYSNA